MIQCLSSKLCNVYHLEMMQCLSFGNDAMFINRIENNEWLSLKVQSKTVYLIFQDVYVNILDFSDFLYLYLSFLYLFYFCI